MFGARPDGTGQAVLISAERTTAVGEGLIAVGSHDPNRFFPGMGTLFVRMMGEALAVALRRFDG